MNLPDPIQRIDVSLDGQVVEGQARAVLCSAAASAVSADSCSAADSFPDSAIAVCGRHKKAVMATHISVGALLFFLLLISPLLDANSLL